MSNFDRNTSFGYRGGVSRAGATEIDVGLRAYMVGVYNHMVLGLGVTGFVALATHMLAVVKEGGRQIAFTPFGQMLYASPLRWVVILAPLAFVFFIGFRAERMSATAARNLFLAFSAVMGLSMSSLMIVFTGASIAKVFFITAAAFGGLSLYGYLTKRDLSAMGSFLVMGLWGLVIASLVNLIFQSSALQFGLSILSVFIFAGLTAWDTQSIKDGYYQSAGYGPEVAAKQSVFGALSLYLDFINMFQSLLFLFGDRNND
jgi:FtsH-binding integral membrane protein